MLQGLNVGKSKTIDLKEDLQLMVTKSRYELMLEASPGVILILIQVNKDRKYYYYIFLQKPVGSMSS